MFGGPTDYIFDAEFPTRNLIGLVVRAERLGPPPYGRISYEIDCIDEHANPIDSAGEFSEKDYAILRVVTTPNRFARMVGKEPNEGDWIQLSIQKDPKYPSPIVYHSQLREEGYVEQSRGRLEKAEMLPDIDESRPRYPLSSAPTRGLSLIQNVLSNFSFPDNGFRAKKIFKNLPKASHIIVHDVGQANFITAFTAGIPILHVDAGWPLSFNGRTAPINPSVSKDDAPILLTHWDFDHLHGFYKFPHTQSSVWIVPSQPLGPGCLKIARRLLSNGNLITWDQESLGEAVGIVFKCAGAGKNNLNAIVIILSLIGGKNVLLSGDADYYSMRKGMTKRKFHGLVVTHHGANFRGSAPAPVSSDGECVISVGSGNVYRHPRCQSLKKHLSKGWCIKATGDVLNSRRGDVQL